MSGEGGSRDLGILNLIGLFDGADIERVAELTADCEREWVRSGDLLLHPGHVDPRVFLVLSGRLRLQVDAPRHEAVQTLEIGDSIGELSLIEGIGTGAYVIALEDSEVLALDRGTIWALSDSSHAVARNLLSVLTGRVGRVPIPAHRRNPASPPRVDDRIDGLTGLHNRRWLAEVLDRFGRRVRENGARLCGLLADVDYMRQYNDAYGHVAGDCVLRTVAQVLCDNARPSDVVVRLSGEEFFVLLPDTSVEQARQAAERIRVAVSEAPVTGPDDHPLPPVTVSLGTAELEAGHEADWLIERARAQLARAKQEGRNRVSG